MNFNPDPIIRATLHYTRDADMWLDTMITAMHCGDANGAIGCLHAAYWRLQRAGVIVDDVYQEGSITS